MSTGLQQLTGQARHSVICQQQNDNKWGQVKFGSD